MTQNTVIPNSFQTPNVYVDRLMELLLSDEVRVLWFATRHILGWQDRIAERRGRISLSMFENGFVTGEGVVYAGCGLSRPAISAALEGLTKYRVLTAHGEPNQHGQAWGLLETDPDWEGLEARRAEQKEKNVRRTKKATDGAKRKRAKGSTPHVPDQGSTPHVPVASTPDVPGDQGTGGTPSVHNQTQDQTQDQTQAPSGGEPVVRTHNSRPANPMYDAIQAVWGYTGSLNGEMAKMLRGESTNKSFKAGNIEPAMTPAEVTAWAGWYRATELHGDSSLNMLEDRMKIQSSVTKWRGLGSPSAEDATSVMAGVRLVTQDTISEIWAIPEMEGA